MKRRGIMVAFRHKLLVPPLVVLNLAFDELNILLYLHSAFYPT